MTCIAYRSRILASDTQLTYGDGSKVRVRKIYKLPDGSLFGVAGDSPWTNKMRDWAMSGFPKIRKWPKEAEIEAIHIRLDGTVWLIHHDLDPDKLEEEYYAIGSGGAYALGAMAKGATAVQAAKIAARFDSGTSEPIESETL